LTIPKRYEISNLLASGEQPYPDLDAETREYLTATIKAHNGLRQMPVHISADGILYDGHQRLKILADLGRKQIVPGEWIINSKVAGREDSYAEAMKINDIGKRQQTGKVRAAAMWEMVRRYRASQARIAKKLGMKQQSVSELMNKYKPADIADMPAERVGLDGRTINVSNIGKDITARDDQPTPYEYRQRIKKGLAQIAGKVSNLSTDAQMCGEFSTFEERDGVIAAIDGIIGTLGAVRDRIAAPGTDTAP
jgi:hypothetical protein